MRRAGAPKGEGRANGSIADRGSCVQNNQMYFFNLRSTVAKENQRLLDPSAMSRS